MKSIARLIGFLLLALSPGCKARSAKPDTAPVSGTASHWPVPAGWSHETFSLPPQFAPTLAYHGTEELRFIPGFSAPIAPDFRSYDFVWWLSEPPIFDAATLAAAFTTYFRGLATTVGGSKYQFDPARFRSVLVVQSAGGRERLTGQVFSHDPFSTGHPIALNLEAELRRCPATGQAAIVVALSPRGVTDTLRTALRAAASNIGGT